MVCHVPCYQGLSVVIWCPIITQCSVSAQALWSVSILWPPTLTVSLFLFRSLGTASCCCRVTLRLQCRLWLSHNHLKAQLGEDLLLNWCGVGQILFLTVCCWRPPSAPGHVGLFNAATSFVRASGCTSVYGWVANHPTLRGLKPHPFLAPAFLALWVRLGSLLRVPQATVEVWWGWTPPEGSRRNLQPHSGTSRIRVLEVAGLTSLFPCWHLRRLLSAPGPPFLLG